MTHITWTTDLASLAEDALHDHYDGQHKAQDVCLDMDQEGRVRVHTNPAIGNAVPMDVWHGRTQRWTLPAGILPDALAEARPAIDERLEAIHAGHEVVWDGDNHVGRLTPAARRMVDELQFWIWDRSWRCLDAMEACEYFADAEPAEVARQDPDAMLDEAQAEGIHILGGRAALAGAIEAARREVAA